MAALKQGDPVFVAEREPTPDDAKNGLYYSHFASLSGSVNRIYDDGTICVDVDVATLPDGIRRRHEDTEKAAKLKWLDGLSGEARGRLSENEKQFRLSYKILVSARDLLTSKGGKPVGLKAGAAALAKAPSKLPPPRARTVRSQEARPQRGERQATSGVVAAKPATGKARPKPAPAKEVKSGRAVAAAP